MARVSCRESRERPKGFARATSNENTVEMQEKKCTSVIHAPATGSTASSVGTTQEALRGTITRVDTAARHLTLHTKTAGEVEASCDGGLDDGGSGTDADVRGAESSKGKA